MSAAEVTGLVDRLRPPSDQVMPAYVRTYAPGVWMTQMMHNTEHGTTIIRRNTESQYGITRRVVVVHRDAHVLGHSQKHSHVININNWKVSYCFSYSLILIYTFKIVCGLEEKIVSFQLPQFTLSTNFWTSFSFFFNAILASVPAEFPIVKDYKIVADPLK